MSAQLLADHADHPEVDERDRAVSVNEQVPRVQVGVEEAILEDHLQHDVRAPPGDEVAVHSGFVEGGGIADVHPAPSARG